MVFRRWQILLVLTLVSWLAYTAVAQQRPRQPMRTRPGNQQNNNQNQPEEKKVRPPTDPRLIQLHKEFIEKAIKLAGEHEKSRRLDKAQETYEAILRLVPEYQPAVDGLQGVMNKAVAADRKALDVYANKEWQDSGVNILEGAPVRITATGTWTFKMEHTLGPTGMEIPKELREFNLGALVAMIVSGEPKEDLKPFEVGDASEFVAPKSGRLLLRMYDANPTDNQGKLSVVIQSTFGEE